MSGKLVGSNTNDGNKAIAFDVIDTTKAYVYLMPNVNKFQELLGNQTHTLITASANVSSEWKTNPTGIFNEIEVVEVYGDSQNTKQSKQTSNNSTIIKRTKTPEVYVDSYIGTLQSEGQYLIVFDEELNPDKYLDGSQQVFIITDLISTDSIPDEVAGLLDSKKVTEISLVDIDTYRDNYLHASIQFNLDDTFNKGEIKDLKIDIQSQSLLKSVEVIGEQDGLKEAVDIETKEELTPIMLNCIGDEDKLTMYSPWLDHDFSIPLVWAKKFVTDNTLDSVITKIEARQLILDLLIMTYGYAVDWNFVEYVTEGNDAGKIKGNQYIGYTPFQVSAIAGKNPKQTLDGRFEKYLRDFPQEETTDEIRQINSFIVSLSRYIQSSKAIAGGNNLFNKATNPFILTPSSSINPTLQQNVPNPIPGGTAVNSYVIPETQRFILSSEYFNITTTEIKNKSEVDLNNARVIQLDRKITLPDLENTIIEKDLSPLPNDKNSKSTEDLEFLFYTHIDPSKLEKFFASNETIDVETPKGTEVGPIQSSFGKFGVEYSSASELFQDLKYRGQFKSGTLRKVTETKRLTGIVTSEVFGSGVSSNALWVATGGDLNSAISVSSLSAGYTLLKVAEALKIPTSSIKNFQATLLRENAQSNIGDSKTITASFEISHYVIDDLVYIADGGGFKISSLNRKAIFNKYEWRKQIDAFTTDPTNPQSKYTLQIALESPLQKIQEIIVRSIWGEEITLHISGISKTIILFNKNDESVATERIKLL